MQESDDGLVLGPSARSLAPSAFAQGSQSLCYGETQYRPSREAM